MICWQFCATSETTSLLNPFRPIRFRRECVTFDCRLLGSKDNQLKHSVPLTKPDGVCACVRLYLCVWREFEWIIVSVFASFIRFVSLTVCLVSHKRRSKIEEQEAEEKIKLWTNSISVIIDWAFWSWRICVRAIRVSGQVRKIFFCGGRTNFVQSDWVNCWNFSNENVYAWGWRPRSGPGNQCRLRFTVVVWFEFRCWHGWRWQLLWLRNGSRVSLSSISVNCDPTENFFFFPLFQNELLAHVRCVIRSRNNEFIALSSN